MKKKSHLFRNIILFIISALFLLSFSYYIYTTYSNIEMSSEYDISKISTSNNSVSTTTNLDISNMLEDVSNCVVGISKIKSHSTSIFSTSSLNDLGIGTGIIVSNNGYILSNCHVTGEKFSTCYITLENGNTYDATVLWCNSELDLSVSKINASGLNYVKFGDSSKIKSGETVYAIGNPIGYEFRRTITSGIISAINRTIKIEENNSVSYMTDLIQTDASINPGNSGGPLILSTGEVIGVNSVKITSAEGIGFAIPINVVKPVIEKIVSTGAFDEAYLGIYAYDKETTPYFSSTNVPNGIYIAHINKDSPAYSSGIKIGDIITSIDDNKRIYSIATSTPRLLKPFLNIKYSLDVHNSHPLLFNSILMSYYNIPTSLMDKIYPIYEKIYTSNVESHNVRPFLRKTLITNNIEEENIKSIPIDVLYYMYLTSMGLFWDVTIPKEMVDEKNLLRSDIKVLMFREVFYSKKLTARGKEYAKIFAKEFPNVYTVVLDSKRENRTKLANDMMKIESELFGKILVELYAKKFKVISIHDAIVVLDVKQNEKCTEEVVKQVMTDVYRKYGLHPDISVDYYGKECMEDRGRR